MFQRGGQTCPTKEAKVNVCGKIAKLKGESFTMYFYHGEVSDQGRGQVSYDFSGSARIEGLEISIEDGTPPHEYMRGCSNGSCPISITIKGEHVYTFTKWTVASPEYNAETNTATVTLISNEHIQTDAGDLGFNYYRAA